MEGDIWTLRGPVRWICDLDHNDPDWELPQCSRASFPGPVMRLRQTAKDIPGVGRFRIREVILLFLPHAAMADVVAGA